MDLVNLVFYMYGVVRYIWFMSDICHLVKTTRNCWENSSKNGTRHLEVLLKNLFSYFLVSQQRNGKHILWSHFIELYEWNRENSGLYIGNKLKMEHLKLNSYSRMNVRLAAQVPMPTCPNFKQIINFNIITDSQ